MMEASDFSADKALRRRECDSMKQQLPRRSSQEVGTPEVQKDAKHASAESTKHKAIRSKVSNNERKRIIIRGRKANWIRGHMCQTGSGFRPRRILIRAPLFALYLLLRL